MDVKDGDLCIMSAFPLVSIANVAEHIQEVEFLTNCRPMCIRVNTHTRVRLSCMVQSIVSLVDSGAPIPESIMGVPLVTDDNMAHDIIYILCSAR